MSDSPGAMPAVPAGFYGPDGSIAADHDCKRCGYNLRGLREMGRCPECGTPVGLSVRGDLLRFADPDWVDKVALGLKIILWMILIGVIVGFVSSFLGVVSQAGSALLSFAAGIVSFYGVWLMTEPDPSGIGEDPNLTARKVVRIALIFGLVGQGAAAVMQGSPGTLMMPLIVVATLCGLVGMVGEFAKFIYYQRLAERIPDHSMADRARFLRWAYTISLGVVVLSGAAMFAMMGLAAPKPGGPGGGAIGFGCIAGIAGLAMLVFGVMTLFLLLRLRKSIAEQARLARESWAATNFVGSAGGMG